MAGVHGSRCTRKCCHCDGLMVAHMAVLNKRLVSSMVLDRLDMELSTTRLDVHNDVHDLGMSTDPLAIKKQTLESAVLEWLRGLSTPNESLG